MINMRNTTALQDSDVDNRMNNNNKALFTTFQCDGCFEVKDKPECHKVIVDGILSELCSSCHAKVDNDDNDQYEEFWCPPRFLR